MRHAFSKHGGNLGEPGSVAYLFEKKGTLVIDAARYSEDDLMAAVEAGAEDIVTDDGTFEVLAEPASFSAVIGALSAAGVETDSAEMSYRPTSLVPIDEGQARKLMNLTDALEELDDVDEVHANFARKPCVFPVLELKLGEPNQQKRTPELREQPGVHTGGLISHARRHDRCRVGNKRGAGHGPGGSRGLVA